MAIVWSTATGQQVHRLIGHASGVQAVGFHPDRHQALTAAGSSCVTWDLATGRKLAESRASAGRGMCLAFSFDCRTVITGSGDRSAGVWDAVTGNTITELRGTELSHSFATLAANGRYAMIGAGIDHSRTMLWEIGSGQAPIACECRALGEFVTRTALDPGGCHLVVGAHDLGAVLWETDTGRVVHGWRESGGEIAAIAFNADGRKAMIGTRDGSTVVWDAESGRKLRTFTPPAGVDSGSGGISAVAFSPDGRQVIVAHSRSQANRTIAVMELWDMGTAQRLRDFQGHRLPVAALAFSPDGTRT